MPGQMAYLLDRFSIRFRPLTADETRGVTVTAAEAARTALDFDPNQTRKLLVCEFLGLFERLEPNHNNPTLSSPAYFVLTSGVPDKLSPLGAQLFFIDAMTRERLATLDLDRPTAEALAWNCGLQPA